MKKYLLLILIPALLIVASCRTEKPWQQLYNGENIENWDKHLGSALKGFDELAETATIDKVFSIVEENGEKLIRISGEVNGSLATRESFENYHLQVVFKWGKNVYTNYNSGVLYHSFGDFGKALETWMVNIECQLMRGNMGDTYLMNNTTCESAVKGIPGGFQYDKTGEVMQFGKDFNGQVVRKGGDYENPAGEWNTIDLYCVGRTAVHVVNGKTTMVNNNTGVYENGEIVPLSSGKIQLQSEGSEMFVKTIQIRPIKKIPAGVL